MNFRRSVVFAVLILGGLTSAFAADITGKWAAQFDSQVGLQKYVFEFKVEGTTLTGKASSTIGDAKAETPLKEGKVEGDVVSFVENLNYQGMELRIVYKGTISGNEIKFSRDVGGQGGENFVAKRVE